MVHQLDQSEFADRRRRFAEALAPNSIAILASGRDVLRNGDTAYPFRPDSDFYYLTGFTEADAVAVLIKHGADAKCDYVLFNRPADAKQEQWLGKRAGQTGACRDYGADNAYPIAELSEQLSQWFLDRDNVYYRFSEDPQLDQWVLKAKAQSEAIRRAGQRVPQHWIEPQTISHEQRLIKSPAEIALMRKACRLSALAHCMAMRRCQPGLYEYQLAAELHYVMQHGGARDVAYPSIVAGGANACVLHYVSNDQILRDGDLVLIDAGAEYQCYSADITRSFPVNGRFTREQQALYEIVLAANEACIQQSQPGLSAHANQELTIEILTQGLVDVGILQGNVNALIADKAYLPFYMHRVSHWLGLDTHDCGAYKRNQQWRELAAGMVLTIEPGLYITPGMQGVDEKWWGIGIRIEDDIFINEQGAECLTADVPKDIPGMQAMMRNT